MLIQEIIEDYTTLIRTYSDCGKMIRSKDNGCLFDEAIDPERFHRQYEETDIDITIESNDNEHTPEEVKENVS